MKKSVSTAEIEKTIKYYQDQAERHANSCAGLINQGKLAEAIEYCKSKHIDPPKCSLTAESKNADNMRSLARRMLSDKKWWSRRLQKYGVQTFEHKQRMAGKVTNYVSDELFAWHQKNKKRR